MHINTLAEEVGKGSDAAGGKSVIYNTITQPPSTFNYMLYYLLFTIQIFIIFIILIFIPKFHFEFKKLY